MEPQGMMFTSKEVLDELHRFVQSRGSQKAAAYALCVSRAYLNDILHGNRDIGPSIYEPLGFRRVIFYEKVQP